MNKIFLNGRRAFPLFFFLYIVSGCSTKQISKGYEKAVRLRINWQLVGGETEAVSMHVVDSIFFVKRPDCFVYLVPHATEHSKMIVDDNKGTIKDSFLFQTINFQAFIFQKDDLTGLRFDSLSATNGKKFNVDSFLVNKAFKGMSSYSEENNILVEETYLDNKKGFVEKYIPKIKQENAFDSTYFFFTKEKIETDISFSKLLEEKRKAKLYKLVGVYIEIPVGKYPFVVPRREMVWELTNVNLPYQKEVDVLIGIYKKSILTMKE